MKIVIVLCSLATFAIAVPVYQENFIESSLIKQPSSTKRERKSTLPDITSGLSPKHGIEKNPIHSSKTTGQETSVEVKDFRRPIIIKRKFGYHVYRDSDEEMAHAEPGEKCREQVKFKLCDHEPVLSSKNGIKSSTFTCVDSHKTDNDMENSIKMAKEAVEYLQRDLKRMKNFTPKMGNPHTEDIESNTGLHHDIEIAREALEHIEHNFESVNLEANKVNELQMSKSQDKERITRWREAIENIHKNFEIVKNIEDAFKSDNHYSLLLSNSRKAVESEEPAHSDIHLNVQHKFINDNLANNDEIYNVDRILKSASNDVVIAQVRPKTENVDLIEKDAGNDMFISPIENRKENMQLHSDSLKSEIHSKDTSLRNTDSEGKSSRYDTIVPKESIEYSQKNSNPLSEVAKYSEQEKTMYDHIGDYHELLAKVSSGSSESLHENVRNDEQKGIDKFQLMMKSALPERENRNPIIKMKSVKEILKNKKDQEKAAKNNEDNFNEFEELFFKSKNENSPLDKLNLVPKSTIPEASENLEAGGEENKYSDKYYNKVFEDKEQQSKTFNMNMRLSNNQLEKEKEKSTDKINHFSENDKPNTLNGEQSMRTSQSHNEPLAISLDETKLENQEVYEPLFISSEKDKHPEKSTLEFLKSVPELYSDPIALILTDNADNIADQNSHKGEASMRLTESENEKSHKSEYQGYEHSSMRLNMENNSEDKNYQFAKSIPELPSDPIASLPTEKVDITNDQNSHTEEAKMRSSDGQNEKLSLNEYQEGPEGTSLRLDVENKSEYRKSEFSKSVPELSSVSTVSKPTEKVDFTNYEDSRKGDGSTRSSESQNDKMQWNENEAVYEPLPMNLDMDHHSNDPTWPFSKSVPDLQSDPIAALSTDKVYVNNDQDSHREEVNMRWAEGQNEKMQLNENQEVYESLPMTLDFEHYQEDPTRQFSKSFPDLPSDAMLTMPRDKDDITDDQHIDKGEGSTRSSENQNEKWQLNEYKEGPEHTSMRLDVENNSEYPKSDFSKSVPELPSDSTISKPTDKVDFTKDEDSRKGDGSTRSSESQNDKMPWNKNEAVYQSLPISLDFEHHSEDPTVHFLKSVPELQSDPIVSKPIDKVDITDDQHNDNGEWSTRSSENQNEKLQLNEYQEGFAGSSLRLDIENNSEYPKTQFSKSVLELLSDSTVSKPTDKVDFTNGEDSRKGDGSIRSSESENKKMIWNENQAVNEPLPRSLDFKHYPEDPTRQFSKSVPEWLSDAEVLRPIDKVDITDDQHIDKGEESTRSSESQHEKLQLNVYQEGSEGSSLRLDVENNFEYPKSEFPKSVPELPSDSTISKPTDKVDFTKDEDSRKGDGSTRSSESQNDKMQWNENEAVYEPLPMNLDMDHHSDDPTWQFSKSVPDLQSDPIAALSTDKVYVNNDQDSHREEVNMRWAEGQNEKMQLNENQEVYESLPMTLDFEHYQEDPTRQFSKSVPDLPSDPMLLMPRDKDDITDVQHMDKGEGSTRSSESQNEKLQLNVYQEGSEGSSLRLDVENNFEYPKSEFSKSVPELPSDSTISKPIEKVDFTKDEDFRKGDGSTRSSESQNDKMPWNKNEVVYEPLSMNLDMDHHSDDPTWPFSKSVPDLQSDPIAALSTDKVYVNNDQDSHREEVNMRWAEGQNEKMQLNENQEVYESLPMTLDFEHYQEDPTRQFSKSVPDLPSDPMLTMPRDKDGITDDQHIDKGEGSTRSSENQNEILQLNEYKEGPEHASKRLDVENNSEYPKSQFFKSVPELPSDSSVSVPMDKVDIANDQHIDESKDSMRLSASESEKFQLNEYQERPEGSSMRLEMENNSEYPKSESSKSVSELPSDSMVSLLTDQVDVTNDQHFLKDELSMRLSQGQNEKLLLNVNQESHAPLSTRLDTTNHPENNLWQFSKSVPEPYYDPILSMLTDKVDIISNDQNSLKEVPSMRLSQNQNEKLQFNENQEVHEPLPTRSDMTNHPEDRKSQYSKSVPELGSDPMVSMPTDKVEIIQEQHSQKERNMRLSQNQNERSRFDDNLGIHKPLLTKLSIENHPEHSPSQFLKSAPELYMSPSNINNAYNENNFKEEARLSQNHNEKQQINLNDHLYEPLSSRINIGKKIEYESPQVFKSVQGDHSEHMLPIDANKVRFKYEDNDIKDQTIMRLSQNQNENKEIQYPRMSLGVSNEHMYRKDNAEQNMNDFMHLSLAQHQQLHENRDPTLWSSNERQHLNHNFKSLPEYKSVYEYRSRPQLFGDHILDDTLSNRWFQTKQHNDHFVNYYKTIPEEHEEYMNPHFRKHLHRIPVNHRLNDADTFSTHDFPSSRARLVDDMQKYHLEKSSNVDSSMEPSMHMSMREPFAKSGTEFNNMHFNHPHSTARFGVGLPIPSASPGAVGVFPTANAGGCGIPLLLSCSPSVVSGSLARSHISGPVFKSVDDNFKYYMKRNANNIADVPPVKGQKTALPHNQETVANK